MRLLQAALENNSRAATEDIRVDAAVVTVLSKFKEKKNTNGTEGFSQLKRCFHLNPTWHALLPSPAGSKESDWSFRRFVQSSFEFFLNRPNRPFCMGSFPAVYVKQMQQILEMLLLACQVTLWDPWICFLQFAPQVNARSSFR